MQCNDVNSDHDCDLSKTTVAGVVSEEIQTKPNLDSSTNVIKRRFFAKTAQNLATKASRKNALPPSFVLKVFQKYLRREFYWIFGHVIRQTIAKYIEG